MSKTVMEGEGGCFNSGLQINLIFFFFFFIHTRIRINEEFNGDLLLMQCTYISQKTCTCTHITFVTFSTKRKHFPHVYQ